MPEVVLTIKGDAADAVDALGEVGDAVHRVGDEVDRTEKQTQTLSLGLGSRMAVAATGLNAALGLVGGAFRMLRESAENYFQSSEEGRAEWVQVQEQIRGLRGSLFEIVIGTDDAGVAAERLGAIMADVTSVVDGLRVVIGPLVTVVTGPLRVGLGLVSDAFDFLTGRSRDAEAALAAMRAEMERTAQASADADQRVRDFTDAVLGETERGQLATYRREVAEIAEAMGEMGAQALQAGTDADASSEQLAHFGTQIREAINAGDLDRPLTALDEWVTTTGDVMSQTRDMGLTVRDVFAEMGTDVGTTLEALMERYASIDELSGAVYNLGESSEEASHGVRSVGHAAEEAAPKVDKLYQSELRLRELYERDVQIRRDVAAKLIMEQGVVAEQVAAKAGMIVAAEEEATAKRQAIAERFAEAMRRMEQRRMEEQAAAQAQSTQRIQYASAQTVAIIDAWEADYDSALKSIAGKAATVAGPLAGLIGAFNPVVGTAISGFGGILARLAGITSRDASQTVLNQSTVTNVNLTVAGGGSTSSINRRVITEAVERGVREGLGGRR